MNSERGWTLIETLILLCIIGIILAILIPNIMQRAHQKSGTLRCGSSVWHGELKAEPDPYTTNKSVWELKLEDGRVVKGNACSFEPDGP